MSVVRFATSLLVSLSARRAWIEIINNNYNDLTRPVALRKESVDRNDVIRPAIDVFLVALRKESVDRNEGVLDAEKVKKGRSPQGERG